MRNIVCDRQRRGGLYRKVVEQLARRAAELRRRARHVVTEDARVLEVVGLLGDGGDPRGIGPVLTAGHASLRDDFEISTPELDAVVARAVTG